MLETKECPRCGRTVFADMDVCYECLFEFTESDEQVPVEVYAAENSAVSPLSLRVSSSSVSLSFPVPQDGLILGRGSGCDVVLHTPAVSRRHVQVLPYEDGLLVKNLGARNPATVGEQEVRNSARMIKGDVLSVCGTTFTLV